MKKIFKRTLAVFLAAVMVLGAAPLSGFVGLELFGFNSPFATKAEAASATISETDLFMVYPQYLNAENATRLELKCQMDYLSAFSSCSDDDAAVATLVTSLKDGLDISLNLVTSSLGWTDTYAEKNLKDATMTLLNSTVDTDNALIEAIENVEDVYKPLKKWYSASSAVEGTINKELFISESLSYFMQYTTSESVARHILEDIWKQAEKPATLKAIKKVTGVADEAFTIFQLAIQVSELYAVDLEFINIMMENLDKSSDLYEGLSLIKKDKETNAETYVAKNYFTGKALEYIGKGLGKVFDYVTGGAYGVVTAVTGLVAYVLANYVYEGKTATEYIQGVHLAAFANDLSNSLSKLKSKFIMGTGTSEDIETFKVLFSAYVMAMKAAAQSGYNFSTGLYKSGCYPWINIMGNTYTYDAYVKACINQINADISAGKLDTSGNFTSIPSTTYENNVATRLASIKKKYVPNNGSKFTEEFGYCRGNRGFAAKVFYMLYDIKMKPAVDFVNQYEISQDDNLKTIGQLVDTSVTISAVKTLLSKAKVGDLLSCHGKKGPHLMIITSVGTNGITVYDCGSIYNGTTEANNVIREYEFTYGSLAENFSTSRKVTYNTATDYTIDHKGGMTLYRAINRERIDSGEGYALNYYTYDDSVNYVISDGVLTGYNGSRSVLDIPDEVTSIADNCFKNRTSITQVNLPDNLVSIGNSAFEGCTNLHTVNFNAALKTIGNRAFYNCKSLDYAMMGDNVETMGSYVFYNCTSIAAVNISSGLETIESYAFYCCESLKFVKIPNNITEIKNYAFYKLGNLQELELPDSLITIRTRSFACNSKLKRVTGGQNVTTIGHFAFQDCENLYEITLPDSLVTLSPGAFEGTTELNSINIPKSIESSGHSYTIVGIGSGSCGIFQNSGLKQINFDEGITSIPTSLFFMCTSIEEITIPESVVTISNYAFYGTEGIDEIHIPDSVITLGTRSFACNSKLKRVTGGQNVTTIGYFAFQDCENLHEITLPDSLVTLRPGAFEGTTELNSINIPKSIESSGHSYTIVGIGSGSCGIFQNSGLKQINFDEGITSIPTSLFFMCTSIEEITIPESVVTISEYAFFGCESLKLLNLTENIVKINDYAFCGCKSIESVVIPLKTQNVSDCAFSNCTSLKTAEFKNSDTTLGTNMFDGCSMLETVMLPENLKKIPASTFANCSLLETVNIPENITSIDGSAFEDCDALKAIELPSKLSTIGYRAFYDCDSITKVVIPDSVTSLGAYAFYGCEVLSEIDFGIGLKTIPDSAFRLLPALTEVYLPRFLTTIAANAFAENTKLKEVTIPATVTSIQDNSFSYPTRLTVYGLPGSYAQTHATNRRMTFVDVSDLKVDTIKFDKSSYEFLASSTGSKFVADMTIEPKASVEPITFTSSDTSIATVENGVITVKGYGTTTITATTESGKTASCTVTINRKVTSVSLNKSKLSMKEGETATLTANVYPSNATNKKVTWISSNEKVATVSNGTVTAVAPGTATITVKTEDGAYTANCEVTVTSSVVTLESITVKSKPSKTSYEIGESLDTSGLVLTAKYSDGSTKLVNTGYTTSGFSSSTAGTKTVTVSYGGKTTTFTVTVTANTQPDDPVVTTYTVKWIVDGNTTTQTYKEGDRIVKPANPSKSGYTFKGWTPEVPSTMPAYNLTFTAVFEKNADPVVPSEPPKADVIKQPTETTIMYGDAIILHVDASKIPEGGRVEWSADNGNFKYSADGDTCRIDPNKSGTTTFTATIYDAQGNAVSKDEQTMTSKAGFFDKIIAFFKKLFGLTKVIVQSLYTF